MPLKKSLTTYPLHRDDILALTASPSDMWCDHIAILLGDRDTHTPDMLLCNPALLKQETVSPYVATHIYYKPTFSVWNILYNLAKKMRKKHRLYGYNTYRITPRLLRESGLERGIRTHENAYAMTSLATMNNEQRREKFEQLETSLVTHGWNMNQPVCVMICRRYGIYDSMDDGHHRLSLVLMHDIAPISMRFSYASQLPFVSLFNSRPLQSKHG